jgi:hypothetical protein
MDNLPRMKTYAKHYRSLLSIGIPIMIGQLGMIVLSFADTMMVAFQTENEGKGEKIGIKERKKLPHFAFSPFYFNFAKRREKEAYGTDFRHNGEDKGNGTSGGSCQRKCHSVWVARPRRCPQRLRLGHTYTP